MYVLIVTSAITRGMRAAIVAVLHGCGDWLELSDSTFAINTTLPSARLVDCLREAGVSAPMCVIPIKDSFIGALPEKVRTWLHQKSQGQPRIEPAAPDARSH